MVAGSNPASANFFASMFDINFLIVLSACIIYDTVFVTAFVPSPVIVKLQDDVLHKIDKLYDNQVNFWEGQERV